MSNPFITGVGLMNLGACCWYAWRGDWVAALSLAFGAAAGITMAFATIR